MIKPGIVGIAVEGVTGVMSDAAAAILVSTKISFEGHVEGVLDEGYVNGGWWRRA